MENFFGTEKTVMEARVEVKELRVEVLAIRRTLKEGHEMDAKRHSKEVQFIKRANQQI